MPYSMATKSGKRTLALALVVSSRLSTMPERVGAASWADFFETVEDDMIVRYDGWVVIAVLYFVLNLAKR
jgi:hypothetical protein